MRALDPQTGKAVPRAGETSDPAGAPPRRVSSVPRAEDNI
jgi:hypothetical protein